MAEYTLTEAEVRECFQASAEGLDFKREYYERGETFDRWLAEHDREVAEKAWDEGYATGLRDATHGEPGGQPNPYRAAARPSWQEQADG